jgi:hypothetical protein
MVKAACPAVARAHPSGTGGVEDAVVEDVDGDEQAAAPSVTAPPAVPAAARARKRRRRSRMRLIRRMGFILG